MSKNDKKWTFWPYAIMLSFVAIIAAIIHTVVIALDNPVHEDGFMGKYQDVDHAYNEIQISQSKFDEKYQIYIGEFASENGDKFTILKPKNGANISDLKFGRKFLRSLREEGLSLENLEKFAPNFEISNADKIKFKIASKPNFDKISAEIRLTRPETNEFNKALNAKFEDGFISVDEFEIPQQGRWQVIVRLDDTENVGFYKFEFIAIKK